MNTERIQLAIKQLRSERRVDLPETDPPWLFRSVEDPSAFNWVGVLVDTMIRHDKRPNVKGDVTKSLHQWCIGSLSLEDIALLKLTGSKTGAWCYMKQYKHCPKSVISWFGLDDGEFEDIKATITFELGERPTLKQVADLLESMISVA